MKVLVRHTKSCSTLSNPMDCSPPGSSVHATLQGRILECGLPLLSPGDLPDSGIKPASLALQANSLLIELPGKFLLYLPTININRNIKGSKITQVLERLFFKNFPLGRDPTPTVFKKRFSLNKPYLCNQDLSIT